MVLVNFFDADVRHVHQLRISDVSSVKTGVDLALVFDKISLMDWQPTWNSEDSPTLYPEYAIIDGMKIDRLLWSAISVCVPELQEKLCQAIVDYRDEEWTSIE